MSDNAESLGIVRQALAEGWPFERLCFALAGDRVLFPRSARGQRAEMIRRMAGQGMNAKEIARRVGCKKSNVYKVLATFPLRGLKSGMACDTVSA